MKTSPEVQDDEVLIWLLQQMPGGKCAYHTTGHEDGSCKTKDKIPTVNKRRRKSVRQERRTKAGEAKVDNATRDRVMSLPFKSAKRMTQQE
ncbi:hypothetical protein HAX54_028671 [Datura stramonium]|uniref:Uncharacterized protein n=1 Tax=Datura stramonium TaxID=4076 RepID=A0ABS8V6R0_DATST|nr:hypothetical protein [Datura stramonium]